MSLTLTLRLVAIKHYNNGMEFEKVAEDACTWKKETLQTQHCALPLLLLPFLDAERIIGFFGIYCRP